MKISKFTLIQQGVYSGIACIGTGSPQKLHGPYARNLFVNNMYDIVPGADIQDGDLMTFHFGTVDSQLNGALESFELDRNSPFVAEYGSSGTVTNLHFKLTKVYNPNPQS
jgi:hypothetical protein